MRAFAYLKEPLRQGTETCIYKIMLCRAEEGYYLFLYDSNDAVQSVSDVLYPTPEELHQEWDPLIDERGWIRIDGPLPDCQQDAFIPLRVKGRNTGNPKWGRYETLHNGEWVDYPGQENK